MYVNLDGSAFTTPGQLGQIGAALLGHAASATSVGIVGGFLVKGLARATRASRTRDAWDQFINGPYVARHWIVVRTTAGDVYAGKLLHADIGVEPEYRDIILGEPSLLVEDGSYVADSTQALFLPGTEIASISTVHDPALDSRSHAIGETVFRPKLKGDTHHGRQGEDATPATTSTDCPE